MEIFDALMAGFATAATPANLLWALVGCALGTAVGVLPGIGPAVAVAMLLPITAKVEVTASMIFFAGIYYGAMYGGSTTSILLNTPGETASMVTAMEGNKMAKSGRAGAALATSAIGSFVAGTVATVVVTLFAPYVADFAVKLGPPEYFMLMVLAFRAFETPHRQHEAQRAAQNEAQGGDEHGVEQQPGGHPDESLPVRPLVTRALFQFAKTTGQRMGDAQHPTHQQGGRNHPWQEVGANAPVASFRADRAGPPGQAPSKHHDAETQQGLQRLGAR